MSPVEAYLSELSERLEGRLPESVVEARLREARAHLIEAVEIEGERAALRRFGGPAANARAILRQDRGYDTGSGFALSWTVGLGLAAAFLLPNAWMNLHFTATRLEFGLSVWLPFLAALAFAARCLRTRRWLAAPSVLWAAAGIALTYVASTLFPMRLNPVERARSLRAARGAVDEWERNARDVADWRAGRLPPDSAPIVSRFAAIRYVAGLPMEFSTESRSLEMVRGSWRPDLRKVVAERTWRERAWRANGEAWAAEVERFRSLARKDLDWELRTGQPASLPWPERLRFATVGVAQIAAVLLAFNAIALLLGGIVDRWPVPRRGPRGPIVG